MMCQGVERPSARFGLRDRTVAFDFDMACRMAVFYQEQKAEEVRLEAMSGGAFRRATTDSLFTPEAEDYLNQSPQSLGDY